MTAEQEFFVYLLEKYAEYRDMPTGDVLAEWDNKNITGFILGMYEIYHCEAIENAFADIDSLLLSGKPVR
ncbi:MAG: DUF3791 domain-containing protein [Ruminococcus sp.]|nr:DUF3791 domain-containing protein [Ruminococcus sp.]